MLKRWFSRIRGSAPPEPAEHPQPAPTASAGEETSEEPVAPAEPPAPEHSSQWEYKVVQLVSETPPDPASASQKLGGSLSAESLKAQFPEYYAEQNGRQQIADFLNKLGQDRWELVTIQQVANLPLMILKRPSL